MVAKAYSRGILLSWGNALRPAVEQLWEKVNNKARGEPGGGQQGFMDRQPRDGMALTFAGAYLISVTRDPAIQPCPTEYGATG